MTKPWRQKRVASARLIACPFCKAAPGAFCERFEGATGLFVPMRYDVHVARVRRAQYDERMAAK